MSSGFSSKILSLYEKASCSLPSEVVSALKASLKKESKPLARRALEVILKSASISKGKRAPICQDTGIPIFFVKYGRNFSQEEIRNAIISATKTATKKSILRPNAVDSVSGKNSGNNIGEGFPIIYFEEKRGKGLQIDLLLKGGGCEYIGMQYSLPSEALKAERDLEGIRKCVLDAVFRAQGKGCPPMVIGVGIAGARELASFVSLKQLFRKLNDNSKNKKLAVLEKTLLTQINTLGIGPSGLGGKTTALAVKIGSAARHPATFFVDVSFCCWASRKASLKL